MKTKSKLLAVILATLMLVSTLVLTSCDYTTLKEAGSKTDVKKTVSNANTLQANQATPTDINYSLERYNLIRRAYWVNGMREKAVALPCEITKPVGYIVLFVGNAVVGAFTVDGKVSSLNSFLTGNYYYGYTRQGRSSEYYWNQIELADVDGSYGENDNGIFFFTTDGRYLEWTGEYLYSDIPMKVESPVVQFEVAK